MIKKKIAKSCHLELPQKRALLDILDKKFLEKCKSGQKAIYRAVDTGRRHRGEGRGGEPWSLFFAE